MEDRKRVRHDRDNACLCRCGNQHYDRWRDLGALILAALWETTALRVMMSWWRVQGLTDAMRRRRSAWASMPRVGFSRAH